MTSPETTPTARSPLLNLPGELRNQIYAFVFSTSPRDHIDISPGSSDRHINQLQLTCRQLYKETRLLELKLNPVKIDGHISGNSSENLLDDKNPMKSKRMLLDITRSLGPRRISWITSLTLSNQVPPVENAPWLELKEMASTMVHLADVLRDNPALRVKYNMHCFCRATLLNGKKDDKFLDLYIIIRGILVSSVIRDEGLEHMWPTLPALVPVIKEGRERLVSRAGKSPVFQALRQAPLETQKLWERIRFFPNPDIVTEPRSVVLSSPPSGEWALTLQLWATLLRRWMEEGV